MADLAREIDAALSDGSLSCLALDRLWITADGRAKLLDFHAPGTPNSSMPTAATSPTTAQVFLSEVATRVLAGRPGTSSDVGRPPRHSLPVSASALLDTLDCAGVGSWREVVQRTTALMTGPDTVTRRRRASPLALCAVFPLTIPLVSVAMTLGVWPNVVSAVPPEIEDLSKALDELSRLSNPYAVDQRTAFETYIAGSFGATLTDSHLWSNPGTALVLGRQRQLIERIVADHPTVSPDEMAAATAVLSPFLKRVASPGRTAALRASNEYKRAMLVGSVAGGGLLFALIAVAGILSASVFRGGWLLRACDIAMVTENGEPVSRLRGLWRGLVAWTFAILGCYLQIASFLQGLQRQAGPQLVSVPAIGAWAVFFAGAAWAVVHPERGLQDRLAGTYLVPR
jgi:hypothetical protein